MSRSARSLQSLAPYPHKSARTDVTPRSAATVANRPQPHAPPVTWWSSTITVEGCSGPMTATGMSTPAAVTWSSDRTGASPGIAERQRSRRPSASRAPARRPGSCGSAAQALSSRATRTTPTRRTTGTLLLAYHPGMVSGDPTVAVQCGECGAALPGNAKFCLECGTPVPAAAERESRRTVTLLFTDVTGSTAMGEQLDPEAYRDVMGRYFAVARAAVERHGGRVEKFVGDAVLAVFGLPEVREDDALRAVRAASELNGGISALAEDLERELGVRLEVRTGVNTGSVVAGTARAGGSFATGDAVNTAARLEQAAAPGSVLIGEQTYRLV